MTTANNPTIALTVLHAHEDYITQENLNLNKTIGLINADPNINVVLKLTYKRGMTKFFSKYFKQNTDAVGWFLHLIETATTRCGQQSPIVTLNEQVVTDLEDEFDYENVWVLFDNDNRVSHLDYQIKLIKTTTGNVINFDVIMERLVSIGGRASPYEKKVFRLHAASSNYDFYKKVDNHG